MSIQIMQVQNLRGVVGGIKLAWRLRVLALGVGESVTLKVSAKSRMEFENRFFSIAGRCYEKNRDGSRRMGYKPYVRKDWASRTITISRES